MKRTANYSLEAEKLSVMGYDPAGAWNYTASDVDDLLTKRNPAGVTWINVDVLDPDIINRLAKEYHIHPLTVEDILDTDQRPKAEEFDDYLFIVLKAIHRDEEWGDSEHGFDYEQISLVLKNDTVLSFQEKPGDNFGGIRRRILNDAGRVRRAGADYLTYALMDAIVDDYFIVLDTISDEIEEAEDRAADDTDKDFLPDMQRIKQALVHMRRIIWPLRESVSHLIHSNHKLLEEGLGHFLGDLQDNVVHAAETVESHRELAAGAMEVNLAAMSNRMNKIMKVLTIISTIFIPLTFIVGVYGMNFRYMPELEFRLGYPITWLVMMSVAAGMLIFFRRRKWI